MHKFIIKIPKIKFLKYQIHFLWLSQYLSIFDIKIDYIIENDFIVFYFKGKEIDIDDILSAIQTLFKMITVTY